MKRILLIKLSVGIFILYLMSLSTPVHAQTSYYFYVQLKDKNHSPYTLANPTLYLSERALIRRTDFNIAIDSLDLPVNPSYISQIENLGVHVHNASKWMNGLTVILTDSSKMSQVRTLQFVKFVQYTGLLVGPVLAPKAKVQSPLTLNYGIADGQISQLNGKQLHTEGYLGQGMQIGVIDAGFTNVNTNPCFDSLRLQGRLLGTKDIINPQSNIYTEDSHGAMVLSTMTGNLPGQYLGTAPKASYWLIRTEYSPTEYKVETDFWCSGAEFADSVGVDIITSSLGYYTFDDPTMSFSYADMTGKISRASRAATIASQKGIIVLVAAGNEGASAWHYIGSPADADGIISVGAVTSTGVPSSFTSFGPSYDGRTKPEICATGTSSAIVTTAGSPSYGNGTSFATPIMAGMMACLLQRYKSLTTHQHIQDFLNSVFKTGNLFNNPTAQMGYGIPDFVKAEQNLVLLNAVTQVEDKNYTIIYNPVNHNLIFRFSSGFTPSNSFINMYNVIGKLILNTSITDTLFEINTTNLVPGIYAVSVVVNGNAKTEKIIIR